VYLCIYRAHLNLLLLLRIIRPIAVVILCKKRKITFINYCVLTYLWIVFNETIFSVGVSGDCFFSGQPCCASDDTAAQARATVFEALRSEPYGEAIGGLMGGSKGSFGVCMNYVINALWQGSLDYLAGIKKGQEFDAEQMGEEKVREAYASEEKIFLDGINKAVRTMLAPVVARLRAYHKVLTGGRGCMIPADLSSEESGLAKTLVEELERFEGICKKACQLEVLLRREPMASVGAGEGTKDAKERARRKSCP